MAKVRNVLFIMADQLRADYLGCAGHPTLPTPNIDSLARRGVRFDRAFCQGGVCGPSRVSFYTGRYVASHGVSWNRVPLAAHQRTLGDFFGPAGMRVALCGKSHLLADMAGLKRYGIDPASPGGVRLAQGGFEPFDRHEGHVAPPANSKYNEFLRGHGYDADNPWETFANGALDGNGDVVSGWYMRNARRPARIAKEHSETAYHTGRAIAFMDEQGDAPWLLHLSYIKPHWPYLAPAPYNDMFDADAVPPPVRARDERDAAHPVIKAYYEHAESQSFQRDDCRDLVVPTYMGLVKELDDQLGRLFQHMAETGRLDDTLIVFTADHGDFLGDHWLGEKEIFFEQALRLPMIVYDPDARADVSRGKVDSRLVESIDLLPTFLESLQMPVPGHLLEGRSLLPATRGDAAGDSTIAWRDAVFCELDYGFRKARRVLGRGPDECRAWMVRTERWKYVRWQGYPAQLYDLSNDPDELEDRAGDPALTAVESAMKDRLLEWAQGLALRHTMAGEEVERGTDNHRSAGIHIGEW